MTFWPKPCFLKNLDATRFPPPAWLPGMLRLGPTPGAVRSRESSATDDRGFRAAYWADTAGALGRRLDLTAALFLFFMGIAMVAELPAHPERGRMVALVYGAEMAACLLAIIACRLPPLRLWRGPIGAVLAAGLAALMSGYDAWAGNPAEPLAM